MGKKENIGEIFMVNEDGSLVHLGDIKDFEWGDGEEEKDTEHEFSEQITDLADKMSQVFMAFVKKGFSNEQSFELTKTIIKNSINTMEED